MHLNRCNPHVFNRSLTALFGAGSASGYSSCQRSGVAGEMRGAAVGTGLSVFPPNPPSDSSGHDKVPFLPPASGSLDWWLRGRYRNNSQETPRVPPSVPPPAAGGQAVFLSGETRAAISISEVQHCPSQGQRERGRRSPVC